MNLRRTIGILVVVGLSACALVIANLVYQRYTDISSGASSALCKNCNVVVISIDTLSALHLPCYGYKKNTAPNLCAFADNHITFNNSYAQSYFTLPSHFSLFTSLYPSTHRMLQTSLESSRSLDPRYLTLPQILQNHGYSTLYFGPVHSMELPLNKGLSRGFDYIDDSYSYTSKDPTIRYWDKGINMLKNNEQNGKKTFLFLHTFYVHWPYLPLTRDLHFTNETVSSIPVTPDEYFQVSPDYIRFVKSYFQHYPLPRASVTSDVYALYTDFLSANGYDRERQLFNRLTDADCGDFCLQPDYFYERNKNNPKAVRYMKALYDEEILRVDAQVQRVINSLTPLLAKNTILIITSDHGEAFMEHGELGHTTLYNEILRVPLIMSVPQTPARKISIPVETIDVYPTILTLLGLRPQHAIEGTDVSDSIRGLSSARGNPYIISDLYDKVLLQNNVEIIRKQKSITTSQWKLYAKDINHLSDTQTLELYDTQNDPWDTTNVAKLHPTIVDSLVNQLKTYMRSHPVEFSVTPDADTIVPQIETEEQRYFHY